jgi:hypothetical protein
MTGSPPQQALLMTLIMAAISVPLTRLTRSQAPVAPSPTMAESAASTSSVEAAKIPVRLQIKASHLPQKLTLSAEGQVVYSLDDAARPEAGASFQVETAVTLNRVDGGIELVAEASWADGTPDAAVTVTLVPDGLEEKATTVWSTGPTLSGVFSFTW